MVIFSFGMKNLATRDGYREYLQKIERFVVKAENEYEIAYDIGVSMRNDQEIILFHGKPPRGEPGKHQGHEFKNFKIILILGREEGWIGAEWNGHRIKIYQMLTHAIKSQLNMRRALRVPSNYATASAHFRDLYITFRSRLRGEVCASNIPDNIGGKMGQADCPRGKNI